jgi:ketosteroid isomerase-like protein
MVLSAPAAAASDEDEVRTVLTRMNASYNGVDFTGFASHLCPDMLQSAGFAAGWYESRKTDGPTQITVNSVRVTGDVAVANVRFDAANRADTKTLDINLVRDGGDWKACRYSTGRSV